ncbi:hypothetical protein [Funiculus sociatus]|uniref:hypothetical protein n=1 Tax=Funiculus sociatus TaxID=450527 RepID=UPI003D661E3E
MKERPHQRGSTVQLGFINPPALGWVESKLVPHYRKPVAVEFHQPSRLGVG